ncbi:MAG: hypothetical protein ACTSSH_09995 [Candidatus Heimdallarchaeota archaeon]
MSEKKQRRKIKQKPFTKINNEKKIPEEDLAAHPELSRQVEKKPRRKRPKIHHRIPKELVERLNKQAYTNMILGAAVVLGLANITFGILGVLAIFGLSEDNTWKIFEYTAILGWNQLRITGFILIIIGIIIIWSIPYYFRNKTQQADSYLIIGAGIGTIYGVIYLLIILADIISSIVDGLSNSVPISIETYFYLPIMLAFFMVPLFRILSIRHMIVFTDLGIEVEEKYEKDFRTGYRNHFGLRRQFHNHHHRFPRKGKHRGWKWRENEDDNTE